MKTFDVDEFLKESGVKVIIKGKEYVVKDFPMDVPEDVDNKKFLANLIGCPEEDLDDYGMAALLNLYDFLYENLIPKNFQNPLSGDLKR